MPLIPLPQIAYGPYTLPTPGSQIASTTDVAAAVATQSGASYGNPTLTGFSKVNGQQLLTGAGAVDILNEITLLVTTGADAFTLADGVDGQRKEIHMKTDGGDGTLTPTTKTGYTTIVFNDAGDSVVLRFFTTIGWTVVSNFGCTIS